MAYYIYLYTCSYGYMNGLISYLPESEVAVARLNLYSLRQLGARPQPRGSYAYGYATRLHLVISWHTFCSLHAMTSSVHSVTVQMHGKMQSICKKAFPSYSY